MLYTLALILVFFAMANILPFSLLQRMRSLGTGESDTTSRRTGDAPHEPSPIDVVVVRIMLTRGRKLPPDIVDAIFDHAEYWAHSSNEIDFQLEHRSALRLAGHSKNENKFLLRAFPVGLTGIQGKKSLAEELAYDTTEAKPEPLSREHDAAFFAKLANYPTPKLISPVRKIVFTIKSKDQGWVSNPEHRGTYKHSATWFEAGLEKFDADQNCDAHCTYDVRYESPKSTAPALPVCALRPLLPAFETAADGKMTYEHPLGPREKYTIQRNLAGSKQWQTHVVTWSHLDNISPDSDEGQEREEQGRGRESGDGSFVRDMKMGDVVTVWGKVRYGSWANQIEKVKVDVYWAV